MTIPEGVRQWREEQRATLLWRRAAVARDQYREWNDAITTLLLDGFAILRRVVLGCYWPYQGEFDPRSAVRRFREQGARVALPVVVQESASLQFREWAPGVRVNTSGDAISLPVRDRTVVLRPEALLIPMVGFDASGYRLGSGAGNYDRTLAAMVPHPLKIGVAFELSRIPTIRPQPHDVIMDFIVTETGIHCVSEAGLELVTNHSKIFEFLNSVTEKRNRIGGESHCQSVWQAESCAPSATQQYSSPPCYAHEIDPAYREV